MGDYGLELNSNDRALSPVDFSQLSSQSMFSAEPLDLPPTQHPTMQDDTLLEKPAVKQQISSNPESPPSPDQCSDDSILRKAPKSVTEKQHNGTQNKPEPRKGNSHTLSNGNDSSVNSVITSLNQLGLSESTTNVINNSLASIPSFWSTATTDDALIQQGFQTVNGVTFQNFSPVPNPLFTAGLNPQLGMGVHTGPGSQQIASQQRRAITGQHSIGGQRQQASLFPNNSKNYAGWSTASQPSSWSPQRQGNPNPWGSLQAGQRCSLNVPNVSQNSTQSAKKTSHNQSGVNPSMIISPSKFRRSTSYPGNVQPGSVASPKTGLEYVSLEDQRDVLGLQQDHNGTMLDSLRFPPLDSSHLLDIMRTTETQDQLKG
ncbi:hypothetical protein LSH36_91g04005 [Paralvinella palmiformis]|uniref:Uncharacterized protein n=1 Tax=Paralvinella palmiformis TaxID=53620 RepID=A0AAD9K0V1_9ANNE|nr:hypothetical protein LSH36_91g04005 [Paralvinella palmiformis]